MGKCVSKEPSAITIAASTEYLRISNHNNNNNHIINNHNLRRKHSNGSIISNTTIIPTTISDIQLVNGTTKSTNTTTCVLPTRLSTISASKSIDDNENILIIKSESSIQNNQIKNNQNNHSQCQIISNTTATATTTNRILDEDNLNVITNTNTIDGDLIESNLIQNNNQENIELASSNKKDQVKQQESSNNNNASYTNTIKNKGQSESKKSKSKNAGGPETKGTAMSFGFRKILHSTPKKKNLMKEKSNKHQHNNTLNQNELICGEILIDDDQTNENTTTELEFSDKNGNEGFDAQQQLTEHTDTWAAKIQQQQKQQQHKQQTNTGDDDNTTNCPITVSSLSSSSYKNRFGFRSANVRPASTGITPKIHDFQDNFDNNNYSVTKRRSKSASNSTRAMNSNRLNNEQQPQKQLTTTQSQPHHHQNQVRFDDVPKINHIPYSSDSDYYQWKPPERRNYGGGGVSVGDTHNMITHKPPQHHHHQYYSVSSAISTNSGNQTGLTSSNGNTATTAAGAAASNRQHHHHHTLNQPNSINTGMHTNLIVRPTPKSAATNNTNNQQQATTIGKFTLHTASLPKPQYPVPISLTQLHTNTMETKNAKQMANNNRKGFFNSPSTRGDISIDSGISSNLDNNTSNSTTVTTANDYNSQNSTLLNLNTQKSFNFNNNNNQRNINNNVEGNGISGEHTNDATTNRKLHKMRPRNLEMVFNSRHKFEVRDLDTISCESIEPLVLPKLPNIFSTTNQPIPLSGLVRANTTLAYESEQQSEQQAQLQARQRHQKEQIENKSSIRRHSDIESFEEEKLYRDRATVEKHTNKNQNSTSNNNNNNSSKNSSPGSSRASWCHAGESLAFKDCSSISSSSISSTNTNTNQNPKLIFQNESLDDDGISSITINDNLDLLSSLTESVPKANTTKRTSVAAATITATGSGSNKEIIKSITANEHNNKNLTDTKFAEMAAAVNDTLLLDDETSPHDSLVSSSESEEAIQRKCQKKKTIQPQPQINNHNIQFEKDIDEMTLELDNIINNSNTNLGISSLSPDTPTHASNSLSFSDIGKDFLIDDEIADQPALLFNNEQNNENNLELTIASAAAGKHLPNSFTDNTPTLMDLCIKNGSGGNGSGAGDNFQRSPKLSSKSRNLMQAAIELSLRTPISLRKATLLSKAESLDTLSPCESIASDDLMMDFETSSMDSIDRISQSIRSCGGGGYGSGGLFNLDDAELLQEFENKGDEVFREWNNILKVHRTSKDNIISQLPARATRLLQRSRLQQQQASHLNTGSDSPKSNDSFQNHLRRTTATGTASSSRSSSLQYNNNNNNSNRETFSSSDDLLLNDKSFRNSMIQDVLYFKKQLMRLRRILQEEEECLLRTETLNPFEATNGQFFASSSESELLTKTSTTVAAAAATVGTDTGTGTVPGTDSTTTANHKYLLDNNSMQSITTSLNNSSNNCGGLIDDPIQKLADLRRQVVYLQGQVVDRDRTIRFQKSTIEKLENDKEKIPATLSSDITSMSAAEKEVVNSATQTERVRPISIGQQEGLARSKPEYTSYTINQQQQPPIQLTTTEITEISPIQQQQQQSSRRHTVISTTFTNLNPNTKCPRRASIAWEKLQYKPVKTTLIGEPITFNTANTNKNLLNIVEKNNIHQQQLEKNNNISILLNNNQNNNHNLSTKFNNNSTTLLNGGGDCNMNHNNPKLLLLNDNCKKALQFQQQPKVQLNGNIANVNEQQQITTKLSNIQIGGGGDITTTNTQNSIKLSNGNNSSSCSHNNGNSSQLRKVALLNNDSKLKCNSFINKIIQKNHNLKNEFHKQNTTDKLHNINTVTIV